jgi:hypothetical protein
MSRNLILFIALLFFATKSFSQIVRTEKIDTTSNWKKGNKVGLDFTQISFVNWSAGGNNSISGLAKGNFIRQCGTANGRDIRGRSIPAADL